MFSESDERLVSKRQHLRIMYEIDKRYALSVNDRLLYNVWMELARIGEVLEMIGKKVTEMEEKDV